MNCISRRTTTFLKVRGLTRCLSEFLEGMPIMPRRCVSNRKDKIDRRSETQDSWFKRKYFQATIVHCSVVKFWCSCAACRHFRWRTLGNMGTNMSTAMQPHMQYTAKQYGTNQQKETHFMPIVGVYSQPWSSKHTALHVFHVFLLQHTLYSASRADCVHWGPGLRKLTT